MKVCLLQFCGNILYVRQCDSPFVYMVRRFALLNAISVTTNTVYTPDYVHYMLHVNTVRHTAICRLQHTRH